MVGSLGGRAGGGLSTGFKSSLMALALVVLMVQVCVGPIYSNKSLLIELIATMYVY